MSAEYRNNNDGRNEKSNSSHKNRWLTVPRILLLNTIILAFLAYMGGAKDILEFLDDSNRAQLDIALTPNKQVFSGQLISLDYKAPTSGYLSLWNLNSKGEIKNILQVHALNTTNYQRKLTVKANTNVGMEQIIMLWTPQSPNHPQQSYYPNDAAFSGALRMLQDVEKRVAQVFVYQKSALRF